MPPTYSPWLNPFEKIARFALARTRRSLGAGYTGPTNGADVRRSEDWRAYRASRALHDVWSPPPASPWSGFHRPTLFAALDSIPEATIWPAKPIGFEDETAARPPAWLDRATALVLDLPAGASVAWAALASLRGPHEPVATFNNWPHPSALVPMWDALGALLYYAPWQAEARMLRRTASGPAPPALVLDRRRLGPRAGEPKEFDNRYYLLESDLPTAAMLRRAGVERVVYVRPDDATVPDEPDDVNRYLHEVAKKMPVLLARASTTAWTASAPQAWSPTLRKTPFNTVRDPKFSGFKRAAAGGFGELIPEPSSAGG